MSENPIPAPQNVPMHARAEIRWLARSLRGLLALDDLLGETGEIEQMARDAQLRLDALVADEDAAKARVVACDRECADKRAATDNEAIETLAKANASQQFADALKAQAEQALAGAHLEATQIHADALAEATALAERTKAETAAGLADVTAAVEAKRSELTALLVELSEETTRHEALVAMHDNFKRSVGLQ